MKFGSSDDEVSLARRAEVRQDFSGAGDHSV